MKFEERNKQWERQLSPKFRQDLRELQDLIKRTAEGPADIFSWMPPPEEQERAKQLNLIIDGSLPTRLFPATKWKRGEPIPEVNTMVQENFSVDEILKRMEAEQLPHTPDGATDAALSIAMDLGHSTINMKCAIAWGIVVDAFRWWDCAMPADNEHGWELTPAASDLGISDVNVWLDRIDDYLGYIWENHSVINEVLGELESEWPRYVENVRELIKASRAAQRGGGGSVEFDLEGRDGKPQFVVVPQSEHSG